MAYILWIMFGLTLGVGNLVLNSHLAVGLLFPVFFLLGAALPTLAVLAQARHKMREVASWRMIWLMFISGGTISILAALLMDGILPFLAYVLLSPLGFLREGLSSLDFGSFDLIERIFFSPMIVVFLLFTAIQAPIPEEIAKALGPALANKHIKNERQAFLIGLASGAGFAVIENMLYEGLYIQWSGWSWGGITLLRGIGAILHPLCTGIISLALFRARQSGRGWLGTVGPAYLLSVGLHTLWNGGFESLVYLTGLDGYLGKGPTFSLYGTSVQALLAIYLVGIAIWLWRRFNLMLNELSQEVEIEPVHAPTSRRVVAGIALAAVAFFVPVGAMLGPSWHSIRAAALGGLPTQTPTLTPTQTPTPAPPFISTGQDYFATATAYPQHTAVVFDEFEQKGKWKTGTLSDSLGSSDLEVEGGKYLWSVSTNKESSWLSRLVVPALPIKFYLVVEATKEGSENASYGLFFRSTSDMRSYYVFQVNPTAQEFSVNSINQTKKTAFILPTKHIAIHKEGINQLAVLGDSSRYLLFINGQFVGNFEDSRLMRGFFGIFVSLTGAGETATFEFDNIKLDY